MNIPTLAMFLIIAMVCTIAGWIGLLFLLGWKVALCIFLIFFGLENRRFIAPIIKKKFDDHRKELMEGSRD